MFERPLHNRIAQVFRALNAPLLPCCGRRFAPYGEFAEAFPDDPIALPLPRLTAHDVCLGSQKKAIGRHREQ